MPILCPKNSNSSLKKSDLDSLTFNFTHEISERYSQDVGDVVVESH